MRNVFFLTGFLLFWTLAGAASPKASFQLQTDAFAKNDLIPARYTCEGKNISPPFTWIGEPAATQSFVLIMNDPDAPAGDWIHWIVFDIPKAVHGLSENDRLSNGEKFGKNSWGNAAYGGPCPPSGVHRYYFTLYALDILPIFPENPTVDQVQSMIRGHVLAESQWMGRYQKGDNAH